jgi:hypothetical protein
MDYRGLRPRQGRMVRTQSSRPGTGGGRVAAMGHDVDILNSASNRSISHLTILIRMAWPKIRGLLVRLSAGSRGRLAFPLHPGTSGGQELRGRYLGSLYHNRSERPVRNGWTVIDPTDRCEFATRRGEPPAGRAPDPPPPGGPESGGIRRPAPTRSAYNVRRRSGLDGAADFARISCSHSQCLLGLFPCFTPKLIRLARIGFGVQPKSFPGMPLSPRWNGGLIQTRLIMWTWVCSPVRGRSTLRITAG